MGLLDKLWDDVAGGSPPDKGLKQLRKEKSGKGAQVTGGPLDAANIVDRRAGGDGFQTSKAVAIRRPLGLGSLSTDTSVGTPSSLGSTPPASPSMASPSTYTAEKDNIWRSVFHPGQNKVMRKVGSDKFDKAQPNSPTVYDWLYSSDTKSEYR